MGRGEKIPVILTDYINRYMNMKKLLLIPLFLMIVSCWPLIMDEDVSLEICQVNYTGKVYRTYGLLYSKHFNMEGYGFRTSYADSTECIFTVVERYFGGKEQYQIQNVFFYVSGTWGEFFHREQIDSIYLITFEDENKMKKWAETHDDNLLVKRDGYSLNELGAKNNYHTVELKID